MGLGRGALLWLLGVPLPIIILLVLFWRYKYGRSGKSASAICSPFCDRSDKGARGGRCALLTAFLGTRVTEVLTGSASACTKVVSKHTSRIGSTPRTPVDAMYAAGELLEPFGLVRRRAALQPAGRNPWRKAP